MLHLRPLGGMDAYINKRTYIGDEDGLELASAMAPFLFLTGRNKRSFSRSGDEVVGRVLWWDQRLRLTVWCVMSGGAVALAVLVH